MTDIEQSIDMENIVIKHKENLDRLIAYSVRGILQPADFVLEFAKMQNQALLRCLALVPEKDKKKMFIQLTKLFNG